ncbi:MAG: BACON domain-containing protein [Alistipes sp.]|nr:BACON domain-containing protein [Alistipes sp.]
MKLKNLFYLMLAVPMVFAACSKTTEEVKPGPETPEDPGKEPEVEYVVDAEMAQAMRVREIEVGGWVSPDNQFLLAFTDENENHTFTVFLIGELEDTTLQAGTYTIEDENVDKDLTSYTYVTDDDSESSEPIQFAEATVVVAVEGDVYDIVGTFVTAEGENYRFTYNGEIAGMVVEEPEPETKAPVFELVSEEVMEFGQEQELGSIEYKLENAVEGVEVSAKANAAWISNVVVKENTIEFVVAANDGAAREAKITATYGMLEFKVTVKQAAYVAPAPVLEITSTLEAFAFEGGEGVLAYVLENAVEGVELQATADVDWITINSAADGVVAFTVAKNETNSQRGGNITLTYGEVSATAKVEQLFEGYDPSVTYGVFSITEVRANAISNDTWNLVLFEHDRILGEMYTRITVKLPKANAQYITDGTYSVADGTIIPNNSADTGSGSYYRYNGNGLPIYDATLNITVDKENETAKFDGVFKVAGGEYTFSWDGAVNGFVYQDLDAGITDWDYFYIYSHWDDTKYVVAYSGGIRFDWYLKKLGGKKSDPVAAGTYVVSDWESTTTKDYVDSSATKINGVLLQNGGVVTITEVAEGYKFEFDVTDKNGTNWKGAYTGPIELNASFNPYN